MSQGQLSPSDEVRATRSGPGTAGLTIGSRWRRCGGLRPILSPRAGAAVRTEDPAFWASVSLEAAASALPDESERPDLVVVDEAHAPGGDAIAGPPVRTVVAPPGKLHDKLAHELTELRRSGARIMDASCRK